MDAQPNDEKDDDDKLGGEDLATIATCIEGMEDTLERIATALEKPEAAEKPDVAPVVNLSPQIHLPAAAKSEPHGWAFTFHRDGEGRLSGCTVTPTK